MGLPLDYAKWYSQFYTDTDYIKETQTYLKQQANALGLDKAKTMISIGAGEGEIDSYLIQSCTSNLNHYIGVEPDKFRFDKLSSQISGSPNLKVTFINDWLPGWKGPSEAVDIVLFCHSLYFIPDKMAAVRQCYSWLKPGGSVIILLTCEDTIFGRIANHHNPSPSPMYMYGSLQRDIAKEGLPWHEGPQMTCLLPSDIDDDNLLSLYFGLFVGEFLRDEMAVLIKSFRETWKNDETMNEVPVGCMVITKPDN